MSSSITRKRSTYKGTSFLVFEKELQKDIKLVYRLNEDERLDALDAVFDKLLDETEKRLTEKE